MAIAWMLFSHIGRVGSAHPVFRIRLHRWGHS
jgi:hypothetical protein